MPWLNALRPEGDSESQIGKDFEVTGVPKTVLVNQDGTIVQVNPSEEELEGFLKEHLGDLSESKETFRAPCPPVTVPGLCPRQSNSNSLEPK